MDSVEEKKYEGVYTNYAIYIDNHLADIAVSNQYPDVEAKVYDYLYKICYVLALKDNYFEVFADYEDFAYYAATEFFTVFKNKYNNQGKIRRGKVVEPIKSSLNYIKNTLYQLNVDYKAKFFSDTSSSRWSEKNSKSAKKKIEDSKQAAVSKYMKESVIRDYSYLIKDAIKESCDKLPGILKHLIFDQSPYKKDKLMCHRIYKTCLISMINSMTIPNKKLNKNLSVEKLVKVYEKEKENYIICWNLDKSLIDYITIIIEKAKSQLFKEIENDRNDLSLDEDSLENILDTAYPTYGIDKNDLGD